MRNFAFLLALAVLPAAPTKYVTDAAGVLAPERRSALNERLAQYERETTHQVIVYIDNRVPQGTTIEEMGAEAIRTWQVGQEKKDNGAILFLFVDDRQSRIEVGYGLEGVLTDAMSKRILVDMRPKLREGDYAGAVEQGVQAIFDTIAAPPAASFVPHGIKASRVPARPPATDWGPLIVAGFLLFLLFIIIKLVRDGRSFIQPNWPSPEPPPETPSNTWPTFDSASPPSWSSSSDSYSSPSSSSSSSSDSSSFTGGGGSGGGGGASDKW